MKTSSTALERRNLGLLVAAQSLGGASPPIIISLGGLVGQMLSSTPTASTLPVSLYQLGLALSTLPAAWLMHRTGRRTAYLLGAVLGVLSGLIAAWGISQSDFVLFCLGTTLAGFYGACVQSYRFAAIDAVGDTTRHASAISRVMVGGLIAAIIGPQVVIWTRDSLPATPFAGSFYSQAALALLALPLLLALRLPPAPPRAESHGARPLYPDDPFVVALAVPAADALPHACGLPRFDLDEAEAGALADFLRSDPSRYEYHAPVPDFGSR